jgi:hypothetical protein
VAATTTMFKKPRFDCSAPCKLLSAAIPLIAAFFIGGIVACYLYRPVDTDPLAAPSYWLQFNGTFVAGGLVTVVIVLAVWVLFAFVILGAQHAACWCLCCGPCRFLWRRPSPAPSSQHAALPSMRGGYTTALGASKDVVL